MADIPSLSDLTGIRSYDEYQQTRKAKNELGKDDFLALLATQLQYQNPMEPQSDTAFIAQLAQFSSLQYMQTMSQSMTSYQYFSLAGKYVYADVTFEDGTREGVEGIVDRVIMQDGKAFAQIGDNLIDCNIITQVYDNDLFSGNNSLLSNANLIGRYIQAYVPTADGKGKDIVAGLCTRVSVTDGALVAYLDSGIKVGLGDIFDISDSPMAADTTDETDETDETEGTDKTSEINDIEETGGGTDETDGPDDAGTGDNI